jgi:hypothetical protein
MPRAEQRLSQPLSVWKDFETLLWGLVGICTTQREHRVTVAISRRGKTLRLELQGGAAPASKGVEPCQRKASPLTSRYRCEWRGHAQRTSKSKQAIAAGQGEP